MTDTIRGAIDALRADARAGASELLGQAVAILRRALTSGDAIDRVARAVADAQPSMAPMWNAALAAIVQGGHSRDDSRAPAPPAFDLFEQRWRRVGRALERVAVESLGPPGRSCVHIVTCSFSGSVLACARALARHAAVRVSCAEGRPALEGRRMAEAMSGEGIDVDFFFDAALGTALVTETGCERLVLVGADAVSPRWMINKVGTGMLAAAAARASVPVFIAATRDKFVDARVAGLLRIEDRDPAEIWDSPPRGVTVRNRYFERVDMDLVSGVITDGGLLAAAMIGEACRAASAGVPDDAIARLVAAG